MQCLYGVISINHHLSSSSPAQEPGNEASMSLDPTPPVDDLYTAYISLHCAYWNPPFQNSTPATEVHYEMVEILAVRWLGTKLIFKETTVGALIKAPLKNIYDPWRCAPWSGKKFFRRSPALYLERRHVIRATVRPKVEVRKSIRSTWQRQRWS